jgi:hypothetical protein
MKGIINTLIMILFVFAALILALFITGRKMKKCCDFIIKDLKAQNALDPASAVLLPYCKRQMFNLGFRDYRPQALEQLLKYSQVQMTGEGKFFLCAGGKPVEPVEDTKAPEPITPAS